MHEIVDELSNFSPSSIEAATKCCAERLRAMPSARLKDVQIASREIDPKGEGLSRKTLTRLRDGSQAPRRMQREKLELLIAAMRSVDPDVDFENISHILATNDDDGRRALIHLCVETWVRNVTSVAARLGSIALELELEMEMKAQSSLHLRELSSLMRQIHFQFGPEWLKGASGIRYLASLTDSIQSVVGCLQDCNSQLQSLDTRSAESKYREAFDYCAKELGARKDDLQDALDQLMHIYWAS